MSVKCNSEKTAINIYSSEHLKYLILLSTYFYKVSKFPYLSTPFYV